MSIHDHVTRSLAFTMHMKNDAGDISISTEVNIHQDCTDMESLEGCKDYVQQKMALDLFRLQKEDASVEFISWVVVNQGGAKITESDTLTYKIRGRKDTEIKAAGIANG